MTKCAETAEGVIKAMGGAENVSYVTHCATRLRFNLKDKAKVDQEAVKAVSGVLGAQFAGDQYQVIIGTTVDAVYREVCARGGFAEQAAIDENLDAPRGAFSLKKLGSNILDGLSGAITPMLPAIIGCSMFMLLVTIFGPTGLNLAPEGSDILTLLNTVGNAAFYFLPMIISYSGAKKFGGNPVLTITIAGIMLHPNIMGLVESGASFSVFGIPTLLMNYSSTLFPMVMISWAEAQVEKFLTKHVPSSIQLLGVPFLTLAVMTPIALCVLGPAGTVVGKGLEVLLLAIHQVLGPIGTGILTAAFTPLVATGMHMPLMITGFASIAEQGSESVMFAGGVAMVFSSIASGLVFFIKAKNAQDRELGASSLVAQAAMGIGEPTIFGILLPHPKLFLFQMAGGFAGGVYAGLMNVTIYAPLVSSVYCPLFYLAGGTTNFMNAIISGVIAFAVTLVLGLMFGYTGNKASEGPKREPVASE